MENRRKRYLRGKARKIKPRIRKRFARRKTTLMKIDYQARTIRITLRQGEYPSISWKSTWFEHRVRGWAVGKAIIFDDRVVSPFNGFKEICVRRVIGWDSDELSLDGYEPCIGFIHVDLKSLQSIKILYGRKKAIAQSRSKRELYEKYVRRYVVETQEGHFFECPRCGLKMNRHRVASINIRRRYLEGKRRAGMRGYPHSNEPEEAMKVELWVGVSEHAIK
ncbi:MAG: hypothetical protein ACO2O0_13925 [Desulfurococcales archaeon]|jgi:hypothetical protein